MQVGKTGEGYGVGSGAIFPAPVWLVQVNRRGGKRGQYLLGRERLVRSWYITSYAGRYAWYVYREYGKD